MKRQEFKAVDEAYERYVADIIAGKHGVAEGALLESLGTLDASPDISRQKFEQAKIYLEGHLFVYLVRAKDAEFLKEFAVYMDHNYSEFIAMAFEALFRKSVRNGNLLEEACGIVLEHGRSDNCYMYCRSLFKQFRKNFPDVILEPIALRLKQKAIDVQFGRG